MRILWVNNVAELLGGTMQATYSMIEALPKATHKVAVFGSCQSACRDAFSKIAKIETVSKTGLQTLVGSYRPELIVYQNTPEDNLPKVDDRYTVEVYYLHSAGGAKTGNRFPRRLCVSDCLAKQVRWPTETVLYQPVTVEAQNSEQEDLEAKVWVGKIATQREEYWRKETLSEFLTHADASSRIDLVTDFRPVEDPRVRYLKPSTSIRSLLWCWDYLLAIDKKETFGRCVREAQLCGCVPIVSKGSGGPEEIVQQWGGLIVGDPKEAWEAIKASQLTYPLRKSEICTPSWWRTEFIRRHVVWNNQ